MTLWMNILWCHRTTYLVLMYNVILDILVVALGDILVVALGDILVVALGDILVVALGDILVVALVDCGTWHPRRGFLVVGLVHPRRGTLGHHRSGLLRLSAVHTPPPAAQYKADVVPP